MLAPIPLVPLFEATNQSLTPAMAAIGSIGRNVAGNAGLLGTASRFLRATRSKPSLRAVSGAVDASGIVRLTAPRPDRRQVGMCGECARSRRRLRPCGRTLVVFTTVAVAARVLHLALKPPTRARVRPIRHPVRRLPLPDMQGVPRPTLENVRVVPARSQVRQQPWRQDRVIDAFRQIDLRWGYNGKPTKSASVDNNGVPVTAAGDEAAYHYGGGASQGSFDVHLVDMLIGHLRRLAVADVARVHG